MPLRTTIAEQANLDEKIAAVTGAVAEAGQKTMPRRAVMRLMLGAGAAALAGAAIAPLQRARAQDVITEFHTSQPYTVSTAANFRSGPGTNYSIIDVIQPGETFTLNAQEQNGFYSVNFQGTNGWVFAELIVDAGTTDPGDSVGVARTTTDVNFRSQPSLSGPIITVIPAGTQVSLQSGSSNGFRAVGYNGTYGWVYADYLSTSSDPGPGDPGPVIGNAVTTTDLNLRSGPSTSNQVLRVMPQGSTVQITGTVQNGFRYVIHNGLAGWAHADYLSQDPGAGQPATYKTTTVDLNLRAEPSTSAKVLAVMPAGSKVRSTDQLANGFRQVVYNGTTGWAWNGYLA
ncbi:MAG: SH3 domain-containing protein [Chloroflexota bacterium]|nr:SH3 domain-containing protein [Chloroflexota bacterium]